MSILSNVIFFNYWNLSHLLNVGSISSFSSSGNREWLKAVAMDFCPFPFEESVTGDYKKVHDVY